MLLEVLQHPHPILAQKAEKITEFNEALKVLATDMYETMKANEGIGLAAPQIGKSIRFVVIEIKNITEKPIFLVNPELTLSGEVVDSEEGCLSVKEYNNTIERYSHVVCTAQDLEGKPFTIEADNNILGICLQHEVDHLDGICFVDKMSRLKKMLYEKHLKKQRKLLLIEERSKTRA